MERTVNHGMKIERALTSDEETDLAIHEYKECHSLYVNENYKYICLSSGKAMLLEVSALTN